MTRARGKRILSQYLPTYFSLRPDAGTESRKQFESAVRRFSALLGHPATLSDLTETTIRDFLAEYRGNHSSATTNSLRAHLLAIWRTAWELGDLPAPPKTRQIPKCKPKASLPEAWSSTEVYRLVEAVETYRRRYRTSPTAAWWRAILLTCYYTGERIGAILSAELSDFSADNGWLSFRHTKTGQPRLCAIPLDCVEAIAAIAADRPAGETRLFWCRISKEALRKSLKFVGRAAGLAIGRNRGGVFHKLRRTAGSLVEAQGFDGSLFLGNTRKVFLTHYCDPRLARTTATLPPSLGRAEQ